MEEGGSCSPGFGSSYTKQDTHSKEMEKTESLHLLLRVEQIQGQAESSSTGKAKGKQPGRDHGWQLQWQEGAEGRPEVAAELGEMS